MNILKFAPHPKGQCKSYHQYVTKTQVGNKKIGDTFTVHKTKNCDEDKDVAWNKHFNGSCTFIVSENQPKAEKMYSDAIDPQMIILTKST